MSDIIDSEMGDDINNAAVGKNIKQDVRDNRNQTPVTVYNQFGQGPPIQPQRHLDSDERLDRIEFYLYGDGISAPGILRQQVEILRQQAEMLQRFQSMMFWLYALTAVLAILVLLSILNLVLRGAI